MTPNYNNASKQVADQTSAHKTSSPTNTTAKERDNIIPSKNKSPDDLEIVD